MRVEPLPPQLQQIINRALAKEPRDRYQQIKTMRDELRAVLQDISGMPILQGDAYAPRHFENNVMKRAWNWISGKSNSENTAGRTAPTNSNPPSFAPENTLTATGHEKKSVAILPFKNLVKTRTRISTNSL
jgi:hypothetical protein